MIDYVVVSGDNLPKLYEAIQSKVNEGFIPQGGVATIDWMGGEDKDICYVNFFQAMVKEGE
jgi:hypothetical protein